MGRPAKLDSWHPLKERISRPTPLVPLRSAVVAAPVHREPLARARQAFAPPSSATPDWLSTETARGRAFQRALEVLPGTLTWLLVTAPLWGALLLPLPLAVAVLAFDLFWLYLSVSTAARAVLGYRRLQRDQSVDWRQRYDITAHGRRDCIPWEDVRHIVIIPTYKEPLEILQRTLGSLEAQSVARQLVVVLAFEEREDGAARKAHRLIDQFSGRFAVLRATFHPAGQPGEVVGKSSNENFAARQAKRWLVDEAGYSLDMITVSSCDADTIFHARYFAALQYHFCTDGSRYRRFWQSPILLTNNIWEQPAPLRVGSALSGVHILANLTKRDRVVFPQSTYSLSLRLAHEVGYWDPDVIPEDWHMFLKCFYATAGEVEVDPIFLPTGNDAVNAGGWWPSIRMTYIQHKRHAWGASDIPYAIRQSLAHPEMGKRRRARRLVALTSNHLLWATHWFLLSVGWLLPMALSYVFNVGAQYDTLHWLARITLTVCLIPYIVMIAIDAKLRPPKPRSWTRRQGLLAFVMWFCLPITSFITSTIPALDSQTRLMLGKRLEYRVTEKASS